MYKVVIGLEVHCQLMTNSKGFSKTKNEFIDKPNYNVSPSDLGHPGTLPYPNKEAVHKALKVALALNCKAPDEVIFDRKNYFYPDLPKGYQITQVTKPLGKNGYLMIRLGDTIKKIDIHQLHLEEDTASLEHLANFSLIDYNRSGIPLIEIVTEPCLSSAEEAVAFLETLRNVFLYCGVSEADSKKGQMRCDVNISLMKADASEFGTKVEMKNINAFTTVKNAIEYEIKRQTNLLEKGERVLQETRRFSDEDLKTYPMREKIDAIDYKYFIEPNIPPVKLSKDYLLKIKEELPRLEFDRVNKYMDDYGLSLYDATILAKERSIADYYEEIISYQVDEKISANWVITIIMGSLNKLKLEIKDFFITPKMLSEVIKLVTDEKLSLNHAKTILYKAMDIKQDPLLIIKEEGLEQIDDQEKLRKFVLEAIAENLDVLQEYLEGKDYVANFFIGKVMAKTNRQANPKITLTIIKEELEKRRENNDKK